LLVALGLSISAAPLAVAQAQTGPAELSYRNPQLTPAERARDVVAHMNLEEKARQLGHDAPALPRLGVPKYNWWNEGLHGVARAGVATVFPQAIGMAASWDVRRMRATADVISTEFRAKYLERRHPDGGSDFYRGLTVWSPNINIFRDPRWGRGQETYGEDPYLSGQIGIAFIRGLQGDDPKYLKTIATSKHFAVHSGPESNRHREDVYPSLHDLEDTYLPAFRATVTEGKVESIMCVYNAVWGVPGCASAVLQQQYLRRDWGFQGYVVSDCGAAANIYRKDALHYTDTAPEGVAAGFENGMDLICGDYRNGMTTDPENIVAAVRAGHMSEATVDRALRRLFEARIRLGLFDPQAAFPDITARNYDTPAHHAKSREMAEASMVLLKNDGNLLPFKSAPRTIAVVGPNADSFDALVGNYYGTPSKPVTVLDGIRARYPNARIIHAEGTGLIGPAETPVPDSAFRGLRVQHFGNRDLQGSPVSAAPAKNARVDWKGDRESSARWTGTLTAPETGEYRFRFASENGYRVWIDDQPIVDEWGVGDAPSILSGSVRLRRGKSYAVRVEGFQRGARGEQQLLWSLPSANGDDAVAAAKEADVVIFVGGLSARIEGEEMKVEAKGFAGGDRTSLDLPEPQQKLLERLQATGRPVVLVLMNGSALSVNWADRHIPAIVEAWYPGGEGGHAVAGLLAGDYSPAGRLPVTFYKSADDLPAFDDYSMKGRTYRYFGGEVLYPFGHGLSYTNFTYKNARVSDDTIKAEESVTVSVDVANAGAMDSDEVVQLYVTHPGKEGAAIRTLQGFQRLRIKRGETRTVRFTLKDRQLSVVDPQGRRRIAPGQVNVWIGGGQPLARSGLAQAPGAATSFRIVGEKLLSR
jgi:beta-glucosidase